MCERISEATWDEFAGCSSEEYVKLYIETDKNRTFLSNPKIEEFKAEDIITVSKQEVVLSTTSGNHILVTKYEVIKRKEQNDGAEAGGATQRRDGLDDAVV